MYFGEFLLSKKLVSQEQLVVALVEQLESLPNLYSILLFDKEVAPEILLELIQKQLNTGLDLVALQEKFKLIQDKVFADALFIQNNKKRQLGQILIEKGYISIEVLKDSLNEFLQTPQETTLTTQTTMKEEPQVEDAALESLKELVSSGQLDASALEGLSPSLDTQEIKTASKEEKKEDNKFVEEDPQQINAAALESLKELMDQGKIDSSVLKDLNVEANKVSAADLDLFFSLDKKNQFEEIIQKLDLMIEAMDPNEFWGEFNNYRFHMKSVINGLKLSDSARIEKALLIADRFYEKLTNDQDLEKLKKILNVCKLSFSLVDEYCQLHTSLHSEEKVFKDKSFLANYKSFIEAVNLLN
jgi:hypothetical protein